MPGLTPQQMSDAERLMNEACGAIIGLTLLAANDFQDAKKNLTESIGQFPEELRTVVTPRQRTDTLIENTKHARVTLRELYQLLALIEHPEEDNAPSNGGRIQAG
jgi:hypothetical protein